MLTPAQQTEVEKLVAAGWSRLEAETLVVETTEDIADGEGDATPPAAEPPKGQP